MSDDQVTRLRDARKWFNDGQCCGQVDSVGICAAPACIFGEALKEFSRAADRIEAQAARIVELEARMGDYCEGLEEGIKIGMEEAAKIAENCAADWAKSAKGKYLETKWDYESRADAGEEIAAAIRAAAKEGKP